MKKSFYLIGATLIALSAISCQKELQGVEGQFEEGIPCTLTVENNLWTEDGAKSSYAPGEGISLSGSEQLGLAFFNDEGKIYVDGNSFTIQAKGTNGQYSFTAPAGSTDKKWVAILPYSRALNRISSNANNSRMLGFKLSPVQFPGANTFDPMCDVLISEHFSLNEDNTATITKFKRMTAPFRLKITGLSDGEKISAVTFTSDLGTPGSKTALTGYYYYTTDEEYSKTVIYAAQAANTLSNGVTAVYETPLEKNGDSWPVWLSVAPITLNSGVNVTISVQTANRVYTRTFAITDTFKFSSEKINELTVNIKGEGVVETPAVFQQFLNGYPSGTFAQDTPYTLKASDGTENTWIAGTGKIYSFAPAATENQDFLKRCMEFFAYDNAQLTLPKLQYKYIQKIRIYLHHNASIAVGKLPLDIYDGDYQLAHYDVNMTSDCALYENGYIDIPVPEGYDDMGGLRIVSHWDTKVYNYILISGISLYYVNDPGHKEPKDLYVAFTTAHGGDTSGSFIWPFNEKNPLNGVTATPGEWELTLKDGGHRFYLYAQDDEVNGAIQNSKAGLAFGKVEGQYLQLPAIEGMALTKVTVEAGQATNFGRPAIFDADGIEELVPFPYTAKTNVVVGNKYEWEIAGTEQNTMYNLTLTEPGGWCYIRNINLHYEQENPYARIINCNMVQLNGYTLDYPFSSPDQALIGGGTATASFAGEVKDFVFGDYTFKLYGNLGIIQHTGSVSNPTAGLAVGSAPGCYVEVPAFEGLRIAKIVLESGLATAAQPHIVDLEGNEVKGGAPMSLSGKGVVLTWVLPETEENTPYRISTTYNGAWMYFRDLKVYYEAVEE